MERVTGIEPAWPAWKARSSRRRPGWSVARPAAFVPSTCLSVGCVGSPPGARACRCGLPWLVGSRRRAVVRQERAGRDPQPHRGRNQGRSQEAGDQKHVQQHAQCDQHPAGGDERCCGRDESVHGHDQGGCADQACHGVAAPGGEAQLSPASWNSRLSVPAAPFYLGTRAITVEGASPDRRR